MATLAVPNEEEREAPMSPKSVDPMIAVVSFAGMSPESSMARQTSALSKEEGAPSAPAPTAAAASPAEGARKLSVPGEDPCLAKVDPFNGLDWQRQIREIFDEVLTKKLDEVGLSARRMEERSKTLDKNIEEAISPRPRGAIRSWTAEKAKNGYRQAERGLNGRSGSAQVHAMSGELSEAEPTSRVNFRLGSHRKRTTPSLPPMVGGDSIVPASPSLVVTPAPVEPEAPASVPPALFDSAAAAALGQSDNKGTGKDAFGDSTAGQRALMQMSQNSTVCRTTPSVLGTEDEYRLNVNCSEEPFRRGTSVGSVASSVFIPHTMRAMSLVDKLHRDTLKASLPSRFHGSSYLRLACASIVLNPRFDPTVCTVILANAVSMGASTDFHARKQIESEPMELVVVEKVFLVFFVIELILRLVVQQSTFFRRGSELGWNLFDLCVVLFQVMEEVMARIGSSSQAFGLTGIIRLMRLFRVIRLARILRLIRELRVLVSSISNSMKALVWTLVLMMLMIHSVSLCITQLVTDHRLSLLREGKFAFDEPGRNELVEDLETFFGSLPRCMLSLFEAITGGLDWDNLVVPLLLEVHPLLAIVFVIYVAVSVLAIMNVVTGVFVDSVLASARADKDQYLLNNAREIFSTIDEEMDWESFQRKIDMPEMLEFFKGIDVDPSEAKHIFSLIDLDDSGSINAEEFLTGCVRLHGPSKALETALLLQEVRKLRKEVRREHYLRRDVR